MNVFLIGYRGVGKTSTSRELAQRLGWTAIDADEELESKSGQTIAAIFAAEGEPAFRDREAAIVRELARRDRSVIALGGGAVLREENRRAIADRGPVVWLTADAVTIALRVASDAATAIRRPNLTAQGGQAEIEELLRQREPIYRQSAHLVVDTVGKSPAAVAEEIHSQLPDLVVLFPSPSGRGLG